MNLVKWSLVSPICTGDDFTLCLVWKGTIPVLTNDLRLLRFIHRVFIQWKIVTFPYTFYIDTSLTFQTFVCVNWYLYLILNIGGEDTVTINVVTVKIRIWSVRYLWIIVLLCVRNVTSQLLDCFFFFYSLFSNENSVKKKIVCVDKSSRIGLSVYTSIRT